MGPRRRTERVKRSSDTRPAGAPRQVGLTPTILRRRRDRARGTVLRRNTTEEEREEKRIV